MGKTEDFPISRQRSENCVPAIMFFIRIESRKSSSYVGIDIGANRLGTSIFGTARLEI